MKIELINVASKLHAKGIDLTAGAGVDALLISLRAVAPIDSWDYSFAYDKLTIEAPDGTPMDGFVEYGEVVLDGDPLG